METDNFVAREMAALDPPADWSPDPAAAIRRHHAQRQEQWRSGPGLWWKLAMAAAILLAFAVLPPTRAVAQRLWRYLTVGRVEVLQLDLDRLPESSSLRGKMIVPPTKMAVAESPEDARAQAGFLPRLPRAGVLDGRPRLSTLGQVVFGIHLKADDLRQLLSGAGIGDEVPAAWDGAQILFQTTGTVMAEWSTADMMLIQTPPLTLVAPEIFDLRAFTSLFLRGLRVPRSEADRLADRMAAAPAWMLPLDPEDKVAIKEIALRSGPATMVYDYDTEHPDRVERLTLIWSVPDRFYILSGPFNEAFAIAVANSVE